MTGEIKSKNVYKKALFPNPGAYFTAKLNASSP